MPPATKLLRMQHTSLQFSDTSVQQAHDVQTLFVEGGQYPIKTGTEAGPVSGGLRNRNLLIEAAQDFNHAINFAGDAWVAVDLDIVVPKSLKKEDVFLMSNDGFKGGIHGTDRVLPTISFEYAQEGVGRIHVGSCHYPTKGATPGSPNYKNNQICAEGIAKWMAKAGVGSDLAFVNGDFNMPDRSTDWALGRNFTSIADELEAWKNTGHGPIDGFCSYDRDKRVSPKNFQVLDDKEMKLFSDHYMCRCTWEIRLLVIS